MEGPRAAITGYHAIEEAIRRSGGKGTLLLSDDRKRNIALRELATALGVRVLEATTADLVELAGTGDHRGAVFLPDAADLPTRGDLRSELGRLPGGARLVVILDHITDPQNLGAILRTADQFGADMVVVPDRRAAQVTPAAARASAGASAHVPIVLVSNVSSSLRLLKEAGFWVFGAHLDGEPLSRVRFPERTALVLGSEGRGLAPLVARECDSLVRIPARGHVDSFNVSVAAGILMYDVRRSQGSLDA